MPFSFVSECYLSIDHNGVETKFFPKLLHLRYARGAKGREGEKKRWASRVGGNSTRKGGGRGRLFHVAFGNRRGSHYGGWPARQRGNGAFTAETRRCPKNIKPPFVHCTFSLSRHFFSGSMIIKLPTWPHFCTCKPIRVLVMKTAVRPTAIRLPTTKALTSRFFGYH